MRRTENQGAREQGIGVVNAEVLRETNAGPSATIGAKNAPFFAQDDNLFLIRYLEAGRDLGHLPGTRETRITRRESRIL